MFTNRSIYNLMNRYSLDDYFNTGNICPSTKSNDVMTSNGCKYNILTKKDTATIEIDVAGYNVDDINVYRDGDSLVVEAKPASRPTELHEYQHRGIYMDGFKKSFAIMGYGIAPVYIKNGIMKVELQETKKQDTRVKIEIRS